MFDAKNEDNRIKVNRKPSHNAQQQQTPRPYSLGASISTPSRGTDTLIRLESYDKEREYVLNSIQHGDILEKSPGMC